MEITFRKANWFTSFFRFAFFIILSAPFFSNFLINAKVQNYFINFVKDGWFFFIIGLCFLFWFFYTIQWRFCLDDAGISVYKCGSLKNKIPWDYVKNIDIVSSKISYIQLKTTEIDSIEFECPLFISRRKDFIDLVTRKLPPEMILENFRRYTNMNALGPKV